MDEASSGSEEGMAKRATNVIAAKYLPKGMAAKHAWTLFGASGRPYKKSKKR